MASRRKSSTKNRSGLVSGIIIGLVAGLGAAVGVALYLNKAPLPFMDKASHELDQLLQSAADGSAALDPNQGLYGEHSVGLSPQFSGHEAQIAQELGALAPTAVPTTPAPSTSSESLDQLIARLPTDVGTSGDSTTTIKPAAPSAAPAVASPPKSATTYFLQAGAFRSAQDAEAMRARILLLGLQANVQSGPYENGTINRVRVGPFKGLDAMNQARAQLGAEKIETSVVRP